jgi:hypothetical protein
MLLIFSHNFPVHPAQRRPVCPLPYNAGSLLISGLNLLVGTQNVFKLTPFKEGISTRSLKYQSHCVFPPLFSCVLTSVDLSLSTRAHGTAFHLVSLIDSTRLSPPNFVSSH